LIFFIPEKKYVFFKFVSANNFFLKVKLAAVQLNLLFCIYLPKSPKEWFMLL